MNEKFWKRSKFWVAVAACLIPIINEVFKLNIDMDAVLTAVGGLSSYVVGQGITDLGKAKK